MSESRPQPPAPTMSPLLGRGRADRPARIRMSSGAGAGFIRQRLREPNVVAIMTLAMAAVLCLVAMARAESLIRAVGPIGMTVSDMDRSVGFYGRVLGFEKVSDVEFLEYLTPRDGRPVPPDARANDVAHWQTALVAADVEGASRMVRGSGCTLLSPGVVPLVEQVLGFTRALLIRDPDGHALAVIEPRALSPGPRGGAPTMGAVTSPAALRPSTAAASYEEVSTRETVRPRRFARGVSSWAGVDRLAHHLRQPLRAYSWRLQPLRFAPPPPWPGHSPRAPGARAPGRAGRTRPWPTAGNG